MNNILVNILLVEDSQNDAQLLRHHLSGFDTPKTKLVRVRRLEEACNILKEKAFDVILLDLSLPDSLWLDALKIVRATAPEVPIIILTDHDDESVATQTIQQGAQNYLIKSQINSRYLATSINYALDRHRLTKHLNEARENINVLKTLLPICIRCKKVRDDKAYWSGVESYISEHVDDRFTQGFCPDCLETKSMN